MINLDYGASGSMPDVLSRLDTLVDATPGTTLASFAYLGLDTTVQMNYPQPGVQLTLIGTPGGDGGDQYVGLDRFGRLVDQRWMNSASTDIERVQYDYTPASNRIWRHNTVAAALGVGQDEYYTEDGLYQLSVRQQGTLNSGKTGISGTPAAEEDFTYDPTGNWANYETKTSGTVTLNQPRTHNVDNEILTLSGSTSLVGYDHVGNMTTAPQPAAGTSAYQLTWDAWNRLVKVATASPASTVAVYAYDGLTRRTRKVAGTTTSDFYYSNQWKVLEMDMVTGSTASLKQFVWRGCDEDKLILCDEPSGSPIPRLYAMDDGKNVTAVCDTSGTVQERYGYSGFGAPAFMNASFGALANSTYSWETLFCGYHFDAEAGLYQVRCRYLHPQSGRWLSRDPIRYWLEGVLPVSTEDRNQTQAVSSGYSHQGFTNFFVPPTEAPGPLCLVEEANLYSYALNNPSTNIDPDGRLTLPPIVRLPLKGLGILRLIACADCAAGIGLIETVCGCQSQSLGYGSLQQCLCDLISNNSALNASCSYCYSPASFFVNWKALYGC